MNLIEEFLLLISEIKWTKNERQKVLEALYLCIYLHKDQKRIQGTPYYLHTIEVAIKLIRDFKITDANKICAALLHDSYEDQHKKLAALYIRPPHPLTEKERAYGYLYDSFGERITQIIMGLSNPDAHDVDDDHPDVDQIDVYHNHIIELLKNPDVCVVKLADFLDNAPKIHEITRKKQQIKFLRKYGPVIDMFIGRLIDKKLPKLAIPQEVIEEKIIPQLIALKEEYEELEILKLPR